MLELIPELYGHPSLLQRPQLRFILQVVLEVALQPFVPAVGQNSTSNPVIFVSSNGGGAWSSVTTITDTSEIIINHMHRR